MGRDGLFAIRTWGRGGASFAGDGVGKLPERRASDEHVAQAPQTRGLQGGHQGAGASAWPWGRLLPSCAWLGRPLQSPVAGRCLVSRLFSGQGSLRLGDRAHLPHRKVTAARTRSGLVAPCHSCHPSSSPPSCRRPCSWPWKNVPDCRSQSQNLRVEMEASQVADPAPCPNLPSEPPAVRGIARPVSSHNGGLGPLRSQVESESRAHTDGRGEGAPFGQGRSVGRLRTLNVPFKSEPVVGGGGEPWS